MRFLLQVGYAPDFRQPERGIKDKSRPFGNNIGLVNRKRLSMLDRVWPCGSAMTVDG